MIKKILISAVVISMLFTCTACPSGNETEDSSTPTSQSEMTSSQTETESETTTEATQTTATPTPKPTATPAPTETPTPVPVSETTEATTQTAAPTPKPTATPVPEPTDPPATPTPVPEPEPTEPGPTELERDLYAELDAAVSYAQSLGYIVTDINPGYGFTFTNATDSYSGAVYQSGDRMKCWILTYDPIGSDSDYRYSSYDVDLISMFDGIDSSYMYY